MYSTIGKFYEDPFESALRTKAYIPHTSHVPVKMTWKREIADTYDPKVWGPAFWFTLHTSAAHYPLEASPIVRDRMKYRILALPYEVPCEACRGHASAFIEKHKDQLDQIVSGRHALGKFYTDFHNQVNKRYGKREWNYDEVYAKYSGTAEINRLNYE